MKLLTLQIALLIACPVLTRALPFEATNNASLIKRKSQPNGINVASFNAGNRANLHPNTDVLWQDYLADIIGRCFPPPPPFLPQTIVRPQERINHYGPWTVHTFIASNVLLIDLASVVSWAIFSTGPEVRDDLRPTVADAPWSRSEYYELEAWSNTPPYPPGGGFAILANIRIVIENNGNRHHYSKAPSWRNNPVLAHGVPSCHEDFYHP